MKIRSPLSLSATKISALLLLASPLHPNVSFAQFVTPSQAKQRVEQVVVTATRSPLAVDDVLAQVTLISREDIDAAGTASLIDLLQRKVGVDIRATGGPGQPSSVFIRGTNATHTLVLIDGVRVGSSTSGSTALENLPLAMIERIEVVKGPLSGQYGSDAIGGVIQIFTRNADKDRKDHFGAEIFAGSFSERGATADGAVMMDQTRFVFQASTRRIDAPSATNPLAGSFTYNPDRDPYRNTNGKIGVRHQISAQTSASLDAWQSRGVTNYDSGAGTITTANTQTLSGTIAKLDHRFGASWRSQFTHAQTIDDIVSESSFPSKFKTAQTQSAWQNDVTLANGIAIIGIERHEEEVTSTTRFDRATRTTDAVFASTQQSVGTHRLSANVRGDRETQFGNRTTGGASWGVQIAPGQLVYASVGRAFRAPSFNDLYFPGFSNPALRPERSQSRELAWRVSEGAIGPVRANVAWFDNRIDDLIAFDFVTSKPQNVRRARIRGVEASVDTQWAGIDLGARLTLQSPEDADTGKQLRSRAKLNGGVSLAKRWGAWSVNGDVVGVGRRYDSANESPTSVMPGYALINATVRYQFNKQVSVELVGQNLGDTDTTLARGYNQLGRSVVARVRVVGF